MNVEAIVSYYAANKFCGNRDRVTTAAKYLEGMETVLDAGCGRGELMTVLRESGQDLTYTGIDCVPDHIAECRAKYPETEWLLEDFDTFDFNGRTWDAVVALNIFSGTGWKPVEVIDAVKKLHSLCTKRFLLMFNNSDKEIRQVCSEWPHEEVSNVSGWHNMIWMNR